MVSPVPLLDTDQQLGPHVTVLTGDAGGKYPSGNSTLVQGTHATVLVDPSLTVHQRGGVPATVDRVLVSHAHEDHMVGLGLFPTAAVHAHHDDLLGVHHLDGLMEVYGLAPHIEAMWREDVVEQFHYTPRPDAIGFADGDSWDLGGVRVTALHLSGHTRGHSGFLVEPDGVFFVGDIDLTGFGPYYGDHWSDLDDFEASITRAREVDARAYVTFHQKGVVHGRDTFVEMLDAFAAVIGRREAALLEFLAEPHTMDEIVEHRFVYRPGVEMPFVTSVERRSMTMHLQRLIAAGAAVEVEPGRWRAA
jgi:glyoxylase-like metal-dependent hydrolase (beta-lactamase superfamily II)